MKDQVLRAANRHVLYLPHAIRQMSRPDRMISPAEVVTTVENGDVIEEYLEDARGASCLMSHFPGGRCVHVVCAPKSDYLAIITAYLPDPDIWANNFTSRR